MIGSYENRRAEQGEARPLTWPADQPAPLCITVLFTTVPATLEALRQAAHLASELQARINILFACVVPYPLPLINTGPVPELRMRRFRTVCEQHAIDTQIDIRLCRDVRQCVHDALLPHSVVVLSVSSNWWPWAFERRLARNLKRAGHHVICVPRAKPVKAQSAQ